MRIDRNTALTAAAMALVAVLVLFILPPARDDSEKAFRLIIAGAAIFAAVLRLRRAIRRGDR